MTEAYVVKIGEQFLASAEDGDVGLAPEVKEAKRFLSIEEAEEAAKEYAEPEYKIVPIQVAES
jgi:hypothetical protein